MTRHDESLPRLAPRKPEAHKGDFGFALLIGGSRTMAGAISLAAMAALRGGAGKVRVACPESCQTIVAGFDPCYMAVPLEANQEGQFSATTLPELASLCREATCIGCGPGLGRSTDITQIVVELYRKVSQPMIVDADALNALAAQREILKSPGGPRILTPHPGEFARLVGQERISDTQREKLACTLAADSGVVVLLKGHQTFVTDGRQLRVNKTGNPGMATGGAGDVLTGLITALVCQGLEPFDAAALGAHVHGLAGDITAEQVGPLGMTALDVVQRLPDALRQVIG
jgi:NAD(P)H-hydrate epimerase